MKIEREVLFDDSLGNMEWFRVHYEKLKREYNNKWIIVYNKEVVETEDSFEEVLARARKYDPNRIMVEFIESDEIAMFF